jgi:IPT/TIG domain
MRLGLLLVGLATGCIVTQDSSSTTTPPPPPPVVTGMTPSSGPYGTAVTITGTDFGSGSPTTESVSMIENAPSPYANVPGYADDCGFFTDTWTDTQITGQIPFPCGTAELVVGTAGGKATAGTFTPDVGWNSGPGLGIDELVESRVTSTGIAAGIYRQLYAGTDQGTGLAIFDGSGAGAYLLSGVPSTAGSDGPLDAHLVESDDHAPEVLATLADGSISAFTVDGSAVPTGLTGRVRAVARDDSGIYAWLDAGSGLERARPSTPSWTIDRGPFATAGGVGDPVLDAQVAADGTLWVSFNMPNDDPFDIEGYVALQSLAPQGSAFGAVELADPNSYDDFISQAHIVLAPDGVHMIVIATCEDDGTGVESSLTPRVRTAAQTWSDAPPIDGLAQYAFVGTTLAAVTYDYDTRATAIVPDVTMPSATQVVPVWPIKPSGLAIDPTSQALRVFVGDGISFAPTPQ